MENLGLVDCPLLYTEEDILSVLSSFRHTLQFLSGEFVMHKGLDESLYVGSITRFAWT